MTGSGAVRWRGLRVGICVGTLSAFGMATGAVAGPPCPTAPDMDGGVRAVFANGEVTEYRKLGNDLLEIFEPSGPDGDKGVVYTSQYGLYDLDSSQVSSGQRNPDTQVTLTYSEPAAGLPLPVSGEVWLGAVTTRWPDGHLETDTAVYVFGKGDQRRIDGCDYDIVPVKVSFIAGDDWVMHDYMFIPSLPLAVLTAHQYPGMENPAGRALARMESILR